MNLSSTPMAGPQTRGRRAKNDFSGERERRGGSSVRCPKGVRERNHMKRRTKQQTTEGAVAVAVSIPPVRPPVEAVSQRARAMWNARGCPQGCDEEIWYSAERQVAQEMSRGLPPLEERGVPVPADAGDLAARVQETIAHHSAPDGSASPTTLRPHSPA
jgi:hypothetical protein